MQALVPESKVGSYKKRSDREMRSSCHGAPSTEESLSRDLRN